MKRKIADPAIDAQADHVPASIDRGGVAEAERVAEIRHRIRHSAAHIMADAVLCLIPDAKLTLGPATDEGFYYDIDLPEPLTTEDLDRVERRMREIINANHPFVKKTITRENARSLFEANPYKSEIIDDIPETDQITTYSHGKFTDLCEGPHVATTAEVVAVKLLSVAGAYWRGDEQKQMLQRIYGTAFESKDALEEHLAMLEEALVRDHRKVGRELDLFMFDPVAPASPFFLPKGTVIYNLLIEYIRDIYKSQGYQEVITPQIYSADLWHRSGHYENYQENMFFVNIEDREFGVKPMNCPGHVMMYAAKHHSYRDLPIRYADFARLHRNERSGVTHGLTRVRSFSQDDAHIFCRPTQVQDEIKTFVATLMETYRTFGFQDVEIDLSRRPEKRVGSDAMWDRAEGMLEAALIELNLSYENLPGEGAFYGPKIDFFVRDALNRQWQLGTAQLDFNLPERFLIEFINEEGLSEQPVMIHRALFGSIERFLGILIEHTAGAFPVWLAPVQATLIPIADRHVKYALGVQDRMRKVGIRAEVDAKNDRMNGKIREAQLQKIPYMLVVGDREEADQSVAVRLRSGENQGVRSVDEIIDEILRSVAAREN